MDSSKERFRSVLNCNIRILRYNFLFELLSNIKSIIFSIKSATVSSWMVSLPGAMTKAIFNMVWDVVGPDIFDETPRPERSGGGEKGSRCIL
jgi:hypothetical protein